MRDKKVEALVIGLIAHIFIVFIVFQVMWFSDVQL